MREVTYFVPILALSITGCAGADPSDEAGGFASIGGTMEPGDDDDGESMTSGIPPSEPPSVPDDNSTGASMDESGSTSTAEGGETGDVTFVPSLNQAAYNTSTKQYEFGFQPIPTIPIVNAPDDTDWSRWGMSHDQLSYHLYLMRSGADDTLYQFSYDPSAVAYDYENVVFIAGAPGDADMSRFSILHDGTNSRLYAQSLNAGALRLHQFGFDTSTNQFVYGHSSLAQIEVVAAPPNTEWNGWSMLHDGQNYRLYAYASPTRDAIAQFAYDPSAQQYVHGFQSLTPIDLVDIPLESDRSDFAMLHDGNAYRFFFLTMP